ncbi:restriction endonuclease [Cyanobium gracile]|uniref:Restriction endonuclease n=1 Tax=Cyanobium gracile UHCC 0281 TaxID=3110309 RepID=A0ABU5SZ48_9CYAN|nr:restriction endonuclease [Cyanobium gracile]MEA5443796.1 restriction endonuclease [Cyanobium gracile UHCC 0281]
MTNVWCVRAGGGMYADNFLRGGFVGIGWREISEDLGPIQTRDQLYAVVRRYFPDIQSAILLSNYVNEIHRFLFEIQPNDHVIIPSADTDLLIHGVVDAGTPYYDPSGDDGCPLRHRRPVTWAAEPIRLDLFSTPFRDSIRTLLTVPAHTRMRSLLTVFMVEHKEEFIRALGQTSMVASDSPATRKESHRIVLEQLMQLTPPDFERLVVHLLDALGFEDWERAEHHGALRDVFDACGEIRLSLPARIRLHARFHRGNLGARIGADAVRELRQFIPFGGHGVYITTADFQPAAVAAAAEEGFARISLVNGQQLADLIARHWTHLPGELRDRLSLEQALVRN